MGNTSSKSKGNSSVSMRSTHSAIIDASTASTLMATPPEMADQLQRHRGPQLARSRSGNPDSHLPPPAYDEAVDSKSTPQPLSNKHDKDNRQAYLREPLRQESMDDFLEILREYDTVLVVDDSTSMYRENRWYEAGKALSLLAGLAEQYDHDGVDLHFLNSKEYATGAKAKEVDALFDRVKPSGGTPIGRRLDLLLRAYMDAAEATKAAGLDYARPVNFIVLTDGEPTDSPEDVIVAIARRLDEGKFPLTQIGIQFVQVGTSSSAQKYLQRLDDTLVSTFGIRDIVDTTPSNLYNGHLTPDVLLKIAIGGINRRVDRQKAPASAGMR
ncbi:hypothetical protein FIBSPDRAFT_875629 [Athelia psychrophila]|uniref:VWFA domain-containing protein n=1 Tax=Athelia psychrophila TaxID=1759441 RepID=A0A167XLY6_9AGAM|nr:hypothetical protein FIBSPDRAFT_875629 [Fibularhizoctonia sp. CBS 109695]